jgi:DNA polymerase III subunit alpha
MAKIKSIKPIPDSGIGPNSSTEIFEQINQFANYGFNKSHAAAYAAISFQTAYLKTHYPECYFAAAMNLDLGEVDEVAAFASQLKSRNIMLWAPDVNMSTDIFRPVHLRKARMGHDYAISYALSALRGVGRQAAQDIVAERKSGGRFESVKDFASRLGAKVNRKALLALVHAGAFDRISENRATAASEVDMAKSGNVSSGQMSMFDMVPELDTSERVAEYSFDEKLDREFDVLGHYLSDHPLRGLRKSLFDDNRYFSATIFDTSRTPPRKAQMPAVVCNYDMRITKKGDPMGVLRLSDPDGVYEALAFGDTVSDIKSLMKKKSRVLVHATVIAEEGERRLIVESVENLAAAQSEIEVAA